MLRFESKSDLERYLVRSDLRPPDWLARRPEEPYAFNYEHFRTVHDRRGPLERALGPAAQYAYSASYFAAGCAVGLAIGEPAIGAVGGYLIGVRRGLAARSAYGAAAWVDPSFSIVHLPAWECKEVWGNEVSVTDTEIGRRYGAVSRPGEVSLLVDGDAVGPVTDAQQLFREISHRVPHHLRGAVVAATEHSIGRLRGRRRSIPFMPRRGAF